MISEIGNTNRILGMCKFQLRFRLVHCGMITPLIRCGFLPFFARYSYVVSSTSIVFVKNRNWISDFRGARIRIFAVLGSDHHIFQRIVTKFPIELKLSNADFVLSGE